MQEEVFKTQREFNNKFPSKIYICSNCKSLTGDPFQCPNCGNQSNSLPFKQNTYTYQIEETGKTETIFTPIENERN